LADWQAGGESRKQRSAVEDVETYLPGVRRQVNTTSVVVQILRGHRRKLAVRNAGEAKVQHRSTIMNLVRRRNRLSCGQLTAAICEGREQGSGLPGQHSSSVGNGA